MDLRLVAYAPNGASLGVLPTPQEFAAGVPLNDLGALTVAYAKVGPRASLLGQPVEIAVEASHDGGAFSEPAGCRFLYLRDESDPLALGADVLKAECPGYGFVLSKAYVGTQNLNGEGKRAFSAVTIGTLLKTLIQEAQARGALAGLDHSTFSTTLDSSGAAWAIQVTIAYAPTLSLLAVLRNLSDQGLIDWEFQGRSLRIYNPDTTLAVDRTVTNPATVLRKGQDLKDAPVRRTWEGVANAALIVGDNGVTLERTNPVAIAPWGRWETAIGHGGVSDTGTMTVMSDAALEAAQDVRQEFTHGLDLNRTPFQPFRDYKPGHFLYRQVGTALERLRVRSLSVGRNERREVVGTVVLNDRFLEQEIRNARRVEGITNGGSSGGSGSAPEPLPPVDGKAPAAVTGIVVSSIAYNDVYGLLRALVTVAYSAVTTNADGTAADDIAVYRAWWRLEGQNATQWQLLGETQDAQDLNINGTTPANTAIEVCVQAIDRNGNPSAWEPTVTDHTTANDNTPPPVPSTPTAAAYLGQMKVTWDGLNTAGGGQPIDFLHVEVHVGTTSNFTPSSATLKGDLREAGEFIVTGLTYGTTYYARLVAVDNIGNKSGASAQASAVAARVSGLDVAALAIDTGQLVDAAVAESKIANLAVASAKIKDLAVSTAKIADLAVINAKIANLAVDDAKIGNLAVGKLTAGDLTAAYIRVTGRLTTAAGGAQSGQRTEFDLSGIRAYRSDGALTAEIRSDGASHTMIGTFRTAVSGARIKLEAFAGGQNGIVFDAADNLGRSAAIIFSTPVFLNGITTQEMQMQSGDLAPGDTRRAFVYVNPDRAWLRDARGAGVYCQDNDSQMNNTTGSYVRTVNSEAIMFALVPNIQDAFIRVIAANTSIAQIKIASGQYLEHAPANLNFAQGASGVLRNMTGGGPSGNTGNGYKYVRNNNLDYFWIVNWPDTAHIRVQAAAYDVASDVKWKRNIKAVGPGSSLAAIRAIEAADYEVEGNPTPYAKERKPGSHEWEPDWANHKPVWKAQRGVVAQQVRAALPPALADLIVRGDEEVGLGIDLYGLVTTLVGAVQDLAAEVDSLKRAAPGAGR